MVAFQRKSFPANIFGEDSRRGSRILSLKEWDLESSGEDIIVMGIA